MKLVGCPSDSYIRILFNLNFLICHQSMTLSKNSHRLIVRYRFFDKDGVDAMSFYVRNNTPNPLWVAVGYYDPDCSPPSGDFPTYVPTTAFNMCRIERCQGTGYREVGFDEVNVGNFQNYTLTPIETAGAAKSRNVRAAKTGTRKFKLGKASLRKTPGKLGKLGKTENRDMVNGNNVSFQGCIDAYRGSAAFAIFHAPCYSH